MAACWLSLVNRSPTHPPVVVEPILERPVNSLAMSYCKLLRLFKFGKSLTVAVSFVSCISAPDCKILKGLEVDSLNSISSYNESNCCTECLSSLKWG